MITVKIKDEEVMDVLKESLYEIENLQIKISRQEQEGWEGSKRRMVLKYKIRKLIDITTKIS